MDTIKVRCRSCGKELIGHPSRAISCGCSNMTTIRGDKISAVDLSQVVMLNSYTVRRRMFFLRRMFSGKSQEEREK